MMNLYILPGQKKGGDEAYYLVTEEGEVLYSHWCSYPGYAPGDLLENRPERLEEVKKKFGEYKLMFIDDKEAGITEKELLKRNKEYGDRKKRNDN